jgi:2-oxoglutarate dehydrogenase E1 component
MDPLSFLSNADPSSLESLYQSYTQNPESVEFGWRKFFEGFDFASKSEIGTNVPDASVAGTLHQDHFLKEIKVLNMIDGYRSRGHFWIIGKRFGYVF